MSITLESILVIAAVFAAVSFIVWRFWRKSQGKSECCGKGCGCLMPKKPSKIPAKKA